MRVPGTREAGSARVACTVHGGHCPGSPQAGPAGQALDFRLSLQNGDLSPSEGPRHVLGVGTAAALTLGSSPVRAPLAVSRGLRVTLLPSGLGGLQTGSHAAGAPRCSGPVPPPTWVSGVVPNSKMGFLHWLWGFWNWLCNMVRPKDAKDSPSDGADSTCNPWRELFLEMCRINAVDSPESPLEGGQELGDSVHGTFQLLWGTREHRDAGWLLLSSLDRVVRDRDELRDEVYRLQLRVNDLRVSKSVLGQSLLSCSHRAEVAENQAQALIVRLAELQRKLNSRPRRVSAVKVRALVGKEWDPVRWDGDVWEELDEAADAEPLNPEEACLPVELGLPPPSVVPASPLAASPAPAAAEGISSASPEEAGMASPGAAARQSQAEAPQDPAASPLLSCRQVAGPGSRQAPEAVRSREKARYSPKELLEFSALYKQKTEEQVWEWILRVWDNGGKNLKLVRAEFIDLGSLSRDPAFNLAARGVKKGANSLFGWLAETWVKRWPSVRELEMPDLPWFTLEEGIRRLREIGMVEWLCHLRSTPLPWEGPEDALFTSAVRNRFVRGAPASLKTCVVALLCGPGLTVGTAVTQLENLNAMGMI